MNGLSQAAIRWLESRGIDADTALRIGIYSGRRATTGDDVGGVEPCADGNIIVFPFIEGDKIVAEKYRAAGNRFWQKAGGRKTFFNSTVLDAPE